MVINIAEEVVSFAWLFPWFSIGGRFAAIESFAAGPSPKKCWSGPGTAREKIDWVRIKGGRFRPKVFRKGTYTINVGEGKSKKTLKAVKTLGAGKDNTIEIVFCTIHRGSIETSECNKYFRFN